MAVLSPPPLSSPTPPPETHTTPNRAGWIVATLVVALVAIALVLSVPPGAPAHQLWASTAASQSDPQAAIQQAIKTANDEQAQALSSGNPAVMSDTATAAYYRQLVQINQGLASQNATSIRLTQLTWGPITVTGSSATATTTETWITTFSDGTTTESTDTNVYTLVQQSGTWLIESDQHPAASAQPTPGAGSQPAAPAQPTPAAVTVSQNTSQNWSGYAAAAGGKYTGVSGTWTVPQPSASGAGGVGATWVGIGGINGHDLIQAGTQDVSAAGQDQFQTWIEMLPAASQQVPLAVVPGDSVTVSIDEQSAGSGAWQISVKNNTSGQTYQTTVQYTSSESSAEWIEEAPSGPNGILPLDTFSSVSFSAASAVQNGQTVDLTQLGAQPITMLNANKQLLAVPSPISGTGFTVTRTSAAATTGRGASQGRRPSPTPPGVGG